MYFYIFPYANPQKLINFYRNRRQRFVTKTELQNQINHCQNCGQRLTDKHTKKKDILAEIYFTPLSDELKRNLKLNNARSRKSSMQIRRMGSLGEEPSKANISEEDLSKFAQIARKTFKKPAGIIKRVFMTFIALTTMTVPLLLIIFKREPEQKNKYNEMKRSLILKKQEKGLKCMHKRTSIEQATIFCERYTTGLFEDLELKICVSIENTSKRLSTVMKEAKTLVKKIKCMEIISHSGDLIKGIFNSALFLKDNITKCAQIVTYTKLVTYFLPIPTDSIKASTMKRLRKVIDFNNTELKQMFSSKMNKRSLSVQLKMIGYPAKTIDVIVFFSIEIS